MVTLTSLLPPPPPPWCNPMWPALGYQTFLGTPPPGSGSKKSRNLVPLEVVAKSAGGVALGSFLLLTVFYSALLGRR